jgi:hypothetical protein
MKAEYTELRSFISKFALCLFLEVGGGGGCEGVYMIKTVEVVIDKVTRVLTTGSKRYRATKRQLRQNNSHFMYPFNATILSPFISIGRYKN